MKRSNRNNSRFSVKGQTESNSASFERSIGSLTNAVQTLTDTMKNPPKPKNTGGNGSDKKEKEQAKKRKQAWEDFNDSLGTSGKRMMKGIEGIFGRKAMKNIQGKMFQGFTGQSIKGAGKTLLSGGLKAAGGNLAGLAGSALKAAGAVGSVFTAVKAVFDFINSGKAAQAAADFGAIFNVDTSSMTKDLYESSEEYRKMIADYNIMTPIRLANQARMDSLDQVKSAEMDFLGWQQSKVKDLYDYETGLLRDKVTFEQDQSKQTLDAELSRRKTLFVTDMTYMQKALSIGERALQAIGSSTQAVLESVKNVGISLGTSLKNQVSMATSAAGLGALYMSSADDVLTLSKTFRLMDKSSAKQALNMTAGLKSFAKMNDMEPAQLFKEMADSQEEIFKYTNYTSAEFAKQVVLLKNMNTSMSSMAKASDTMVLNYKDSMKAEMSLSAMLGQNVDLSEARARLMSGDMSGGASALKSALGGIDINSMNPFAKQQLSQATGMNIDELMNLMTGTGSGVKGTLEEKNAKKTGADIANGALQQDISNAAAKLALDQKQRKEMMEFEWVIRKNQLMLEQAQRLQNLAIEQKWRIKFAEAEQEGRLDEAIGKMQAEAASGFFANLFGNQKGMLPEDLKGTAGMKPEDVTKMISGFDKERQGLIAASKGGAIKADDPRLAQYAAQYAKFDLSKDIKDFPKAVDYFGETIKTEIAKLNAPATSVGSLAAAKGEVKSAEAFKAEKGGTWNKFVGSLKLGLAQGGLLSPTIAASGLTDIAIAKASEEQVDVAKRNYANQQQTLKELTDANNWLKQDAKGVESLKGVSTNGWMLMYKQNQQLIGLTSTALLYQQETAANASKPITINGKTLNNTLLNQNAKTYGILNGTPAYQYFSNPANWK